MIRTWTLAALAALILWPAVAPAQETPRPRARPRVERAPSGVFSVNVNRGRIGVLVDTKADAEKDKVGARIEAVTPGGPAEKAGLKAGDIITRFNGIALGGARAEDQDESGPGMKLIELAHALDPGDTVQVEYRRGSESRKATLVADEVEWHGMANVEIPDMMGGVMPRINLGPGQHFEWTFGGPWGGIELVSLNPDLGEYFGTREGVLVVRASGDTTLPLKGGDVILSIGGRKPTSPSHAMRILRSYETGETVSIEVLRKQKRTTLSWNVPEDGGRFRLAPTPRREREEPSAYRLRPMLKLRELELPRIEVAPLKLKLPLRTDRAI